MNRRLLYCNFIFATWLVASGMQGQELPLYSFVILKTFDEDDLQIPQIYSVFDKHIETLLCVPNRINSQILQRQKQIAIGMNTKGYRNYITEVAECRRQPGNLHHPLTPLPELPITKRKWDNLMNQWRQALHRWDEDETTGLIDPKMLEPIPGLPTLKDFGIPCTNSLVLQGQQYGERMQELRRQFPMLVDRDQ